LPFTDGTFDSIYVPFVQNGIGFYHSNLLPLMLTAGIMGFLDIPLKPSTILVFGAFGLSVDDTVRFLSQYREELKKTTGKYANLFMQHLQMPA
jgi:predicted RND superfamily exporter protein